MANRIVSTNDILKLFKTGRLYSIQKVGPGYIIVARLKYLRARKVVAVSTNPFRKIIPTEINGIRLEPSDILFKHYLGHSKLFKKIKQ